MPDQLTMPIRSAMASGGMKIDTASATGGAAVGGIFAAFGDMTTPALIIFGLTVLLIGGRVAQVWIQNCQMIRRGRARARVRRKK